MITPKKISLANIPTPIQKLNFDGKDFLIKRDDFTGIELSGNKVRKLEYLLYQAKKEKAEYVFTCGGEQSNHARATAAASAIAGMKSKLFLNGSNSSPEEGNLFIDKFLGSDISFLNENNYKNVNEIMYEERESFLSKKKNVYVIPEGGSTTLGIWGYISFMEEINSQINLDTVNGIVAASGSGGTAAGLLVGAALLKKKIKVFAVNVLYSPAEIRKKILNLAEGCVLDYKLEINIDETNLEIIDGYSKEGYSNISNNKVRLIKRFAQSSGIIFDPAYTGKAFNAYYDHFLNTGKGKKYIFIHTGGFFGAFAKKDKYLNS
jgi:D-cysteine desulfhydrase